MDRRLQWLAPVAGLVVLLSSPSGYAQSSKAHRLYRSDDPPGAIGHRQMQRCESFFGHEQWLQIVVPRGAQVAVAQGGDFANCPPGRVVLGMLPGRVYRIRIDQVPGLEDVALYPSLELIDGISPPTGCEHQFPIVVAFGYDDLRAAANSAMVTRVVCVEDPQRPVALNMPGSPTARDQQDVFDVLAGEDPLHVGDELGRPVVLVRMGSAQPHVTEPDPGFCFGYPPVQIVAAQPKWEGEPRFTDSPGSLSFVMSDEGSSSKFSCGDMGPCCDCPGGDPSEQYRRRDEVICDGGDFEARARVHIESRKGLDPTETVASFRTRDGEFGYAASNRVCVYAPRFFATRRIVPLVLEATVLQAAGFDQSAPPVIGDQPVVVSHARTALPAYHQHGTRLRHSLETQEPPLLTEDVRNIVDVKDQLLPWESQQQDPAWETLQNTAVGTASIAQPAVDWTLARAAEVILDDQVAFEQDGIRAANEGIVYLAPQGARLRLTKCVGPYPQADGTSLKFTIRFDNVGDETIDEVKIADYLSQRLVLIQETAKCSLAAELGLDRDERGSIRLVWHLRDPLLPGTGGLIEFACTVSP